VFPVILLILNSVQQLYRVTFKIVSIYDSSSTTMHSTHSPPADEDDNVAPEDSASQARSVASSSAKSKLAVKRAALSVRAKVLKDLQEIELRELQCKQQRECLELQVQLAEANAEYQELSDKPVVMSELNPEAAEWVTTSGGNPAAVEVTPRFQMVDNEVQFHIPAPHIGEATEANVAPADRRDIANLISQGQLQQQQMLEALQMPHAELCAFDGDPLKY